MTEVTVRVGPGLFRFESRHDWWDKAQRWFRIARRDHDLTPEAFICIDARGRVCRLGAHFQRAEADGTYPLVVYAVDDLPTVSGTPEDS